MHPSRMSWVTVPSLEIVLVSIFPVKQTPGYFSQAPLSCYFEQDLNTACAMMLSMVSAWMHLEKKSA